MKQSLAKSPFGHCRSQVGQQNPKVDAVTGGRRPSQTSLLGGVSCPPMEPPQ